MNERNLSFNHFNQQQAQDIVARNEGRDSDDEFDENSPTYDSDETVNDIPPLTTRRILVVGCGGCGCNLATDIASALPNDDIFAIGYDTSNRALGGIKANFRVYHEGLDGQGKQRGMAKDSFKVEIYKYLLDKVHNAVAHYPDIQYIIVCTSADGGTGSGVSPMVAKLIKDNTNIPVIVFGVYPRDAEDATAQFNSIEWQSEINKVGVPYILFDNNMSGSNVAEGNRMVNRSAVDACNLIGGHKFGNTNISIVDNRNLNMLLAQIGGRIVTGYIEKKPASTETLDDIVDEMIHANYQIEPDKVRGMAVFVYAKPDLLDRMDTSLQGIQRKYGQAVLRFSHIQEMPKESNELPRFGIILTGCAEASARLKHLYDRHQDIMNAQVATTDTAAEMLAAIGNPLGRVVDSQSDGENWSALDL